MKLCFVIFKYFPYGGLQKSFINIVKACVESGMQLTVLTLSWEGEVPPNVEVVELKGDGWSNHARINAFASKVETFLTANPHKGVVGFNKMPHLDIYYAGDTCLKRSWASKLKSPRQYLPRLRTFLAMESAVFGQANGPEVLAISEQEKQIYQEEYGTDDSQFHLLPPGIRLDVAAAQKSARDIRQELDIDSSSIIALMVGSDFRRKAADRGIELLASLIQSAGADSPALHLIVVGQGKKTTLELLARKLQVAGRVHFVGGQTDVPVWMQQTDMLWHLAREENTGNVILEGMISGLPVVCTRTCGYAFHVENADAGVIVADKPYDVANVTQKVEVFLSKEKRLHSRVNGLAYAQSADLYSRLDKVVAILKHKFAR